MAQIEYDNYCRGFVQSYEDDMKWDFCIARDNYIVHQDWRQSIRQNIPNCNWEEWENEQDNPQEVE